MNREERRRANRSLIAGLALMTAASFAFGWALVPLYDVFCKFTGIGNAEGRAGRATVTEAPDPTRLITVEFVADPASVGSFDFHPLATAMQVHPGKLYDAKFFARNLSGGPSVAQAVPSISPSSAARFFHKTECFCFRPQKFALGEGRDLAIRFIVDPGLPPNVDKLTLSYSLYDTTPQVAAQR
jgi:cytochrome c oxidase assembly protein subunit 11